jgi:hypothetical protein
MIGQGNLPYADSKFIHFGFSLGTNLMDFGVTPSLDTIAGKVYRADVSNLTPGFSVGVITDMRLHRYFNLRFTPTLHFGQRTLSYKANGSSESESFTITSIPLSLPLYLKYSAERRGNYRPYLLWGAGAYIDFDRSLEQPILLQPIDFFTEIGVGCDLYFSFFKLAPELKFALGFNNMVTPDFTPTNAADKKFTTALSKLTSRMFTLTFNFE